MCHFSFLISLETRNISSVVGQGTNYLQQIHNTRNTETRSYSCTVTAVVASATFYP